ncbi:MAG TPA: cytidine deaminase [Bacillota bacterium]|nr:cytidine deaminase [Bacillota bacterium]
MKEKLIEQAKHIREKAYTPYSNFNVGAALLTKSGEIYTGCNIENASYPVSCCAERVAIFNAISEGHKQFQGMAVVADTNGPVSPCGSCRQVMAEFFDKDIPIYLLNLQDNVIETNIEELLPSSFQPKHLEEGK